jgi:nitroreductase
VEAAAVERAIRARRTHKTFGREPLSAEVIEELVELASWAPNHELTEPWRFRVLGPAALAALKDAADPQAAGKLDRAPTLIAASVGQSGDEQRRLEDLCAASAAVYIVLLAADARGLAGYWRTPAVLRTQAGRQALGIPEEELALGLIHLGPRIQERAAPERTARILTWLP